MSVADGDDEEAFFLALDAAEAAALDSSSKRRRLSTTSSPTPATPPAASEGSYLAALKGSHSSAWQQQQQQALNYAHKRPDGSKTLAAGTSGTQVASGSCFKCGDPGHWARECPQSAPTAGGGGVIGGGYVNAGGEVEEKACPCGAGSCLVLTSNTPRNPGRKFYKCPLRDNGGCNFFEWCDAPSPGPANARSNTVFQSETSATDMLCPCGAGACLILTTKTGKNVGRQFYRCPGNQGIAVINTIDESFCGGLDSRVVALVAFSSGVTSNSPGLVHRCKLHHSTKLMQHQASKTPTRGAPHPASSAGRRTTGRGTAQINHRILILTRVGEQ
ncbi:uncharacterized protein [Setaria viridis]|uniref:uncharacterized protein isoform X2 n=1 Tax=Setaria viridis TaxID=4556 RepID=UPI003B3B7D2E